MNEKETPLAPLAVKLVIGFLLALSTGLAVWASYNHLKLNTYRSALQNTYQRAADLASDSLANLSSDLVKGMYAGTSPQLSMISSKMWKESAAAKSALSTLPVADLTLENTNRFLSQAGDYAMYLSRKFAAGEELTEEERAQFAALREYADRLSAQVDRIACELQSGKLSVEELSRADQQMDSADGSAEEAPVSALKQVEDGFMGYPTLIYDGPFSDHLLEKTPLAVQDQPEVSEEQARQIAQRVAGKPLPELREENSALPCYVFHDGESASAAVTRQGGRLCYFITDKPDSLTERLSYEQAAERARRFLEQQGYGSMKDTYYQTDNGVMTLNFACFEPQAQAVCYPDLVKVEVSLEDGAILGMDARGYLVNHTERTLPEPAISPEQAAQSLSPVLEVQSQRLALIPSSGQNETLCYEFVCTSPTGDRVLCYLNCLTGAEEQLLLLLETPGGVLTK
jgi:spore germination protein